MATAGSLIERSLRLLGQLEAGEVPTTDEYADGLEALNAMVDGWNNEKLLCFSYQTESLTLANATSSYTVGTSGDLNTTRPVEVLSAYVVSGNYSYPTHVMTEEEYAAIPDKSATSDFPSHVLFRPTVASSLATVIVWPVPTAANTLKLVTRIVVGSFASTATTVTLPPGWERALTYNLAIEMAPEYEVNPGPAVIKVAAESLASIKKVNMLYRPKRAYSQLAEMFTPHHGDINSDT